VEFPRAAPSGIPQTSLGFRGHLITNFPHSMVLLINNSVFNENNLLNHYIYFFVLYILIKKVLLMFSSIFSLADEKFYEIAKRSPAKVRSLTLSHR
jgi:hypothetical protein